MTGGNSNSGGNGGNPTGPGTTTPAAHTPGVTTGTGTGGGDNGTRRRWRGRHRRRGRLRWPGPPRRRPPGGRRPLLPALHRVRRRRQRRRHASPASPTTPSTSPYRSLDERGFQQTLAELAKANLPDTPEAVIRTVEGMADYFNQNFQLYGRHIEMDIYNGVGGNVNELVGKGRAEAEADAQSVAGLNVFADLSATSEPYTNALCNKGIIALGNPYLSRQYHDERGPCAWSLAVNGTEVAEFAAEFAAKRLAGGTADFAGGDAQGRPRVIATLAPNNPWYQESVVVARQRYTELTGLEPGPNYQYLLDLGQLSNQASELIPKMKADGTTTVICGCDPILPVFLSGVAARENYFPEFIIAGTALTDTDIVGQLWNQEFAAHAFGVSPLDDLLGADQLRRLPGLQVGAARRGAGLRRRGHLLPDVPAGHRPPDGRAQPDARHLPGTACTRTRAQSGPFGLRDFGPGDHTTRRRRPGDLLGPGRASRRTTASRARYVGINGDARYLRDELPSGAFPKP